MITPDITVLENFNDMDFDGAWSFVAQAEVVGGVLYLPGVYTDIRSRTFLDLGEGLASLTISFDALYHKSSHPFPGDNLYLYMEDTDGNPISGGFNVKQDYFGPGIDYDDANYDRPSLWFNDGTEVTRLFDFTNFSSDIYDEWVSYTFHFDNIAGTYAVDMFSDGSVEMEISDPALVGASVLDLHLGAYGWFTGHYGYIDNFELTGTRKTTPVEDYVFFDNFDRADDPDVGNGWRIIQETLPQDAGYTGSSTLNLVDGQLEFDYDTEGVMPGRLATFQQPHMVHALGTDLSETGFEVSFSVTPGDVARVRHVVALTDAEAGTITALQGGGDLLIPKAGIGIEVARSSIYYENSGFRLWRFDGDADFAYESDIPDLMGEGLTSFQFEPFDPFSVSLRVEADGTWSVLFETSDGRESTHAGKMDPITETLDQLSMFSTEASGGYYADRQEIVKIDDIGVRALSPLEPPVESTPFEVNVLTATQLAQASYAPFETDRDTEVAPDITDFQGADARENDEGIYNELFVDNTTDLELIRNFRLEDGTAITDEMGFYVRENAAALVAQADETLIITFRGTNDNTDTIPTVFEAVYGTAMDNQYVGPLGAWNAIKKNNGNGQGHDKIIEKSFERAVPEELQSPDVEDWLDLDSHYLLFEDLMNSVDDMILAAETEVTNVVFIGHSMGGGMAQYAMSDFQGDLHGVTYSAYAFAASGIADNRDNEDRGRFGDDDRIVNLRFDDDPIRIASVWTEQRGDQIILASDDTGDHYPELYVNAAERLLSAGFSEPGDFVNSAGRPFLQIAVRGDTAVGAEFIDTSLPSDALVGTTGSDVIIPKFNLANGSVIAGLEGNDRIDLEKAIGYDAIIFRNGDGRDEISGFEAGKDQLVLRGFDDTDPVSVVAYGGGIILPDLFPPDEIVATWNDESSTSFVDIDDVEAFSLAVFGVLPDDPGIWVSLRLHAFAALPGRSKIDLIPRMATSVLQPSVPSVQERCIGGLQARHGALQRRAVSNRQSSEEERAALFVGDPAGEYFTDDQRRHRNAVPPIRYTSI